ncbi:MAG: hypothetical protein H0X73_13700 [Chthoniobacterales bacterium]|nr:hypothetical protein [Chthoniobacterales bacterium]
MKTTHLQNMRQLRSTRMQADLPTMKGFGEMQYRPGKGCYNQDLNVRKLSTI